HDAEARRPGRPRRRRGVKMATVQGDDSPHARTPLPPAVAAIVAHGARLVRPLAAAERGVACGALDELCRRALATPIGSSALASMVGSGARVAVVVSDATRD